MSEALDVRAPGQLSGRSALARLVTVDRATFAEEVWGRRPLLSRAADLPAPFGDLFDAGAVDTLVSTRGLRTPFLRVAKQGRTLPGGDFTAAGGVGAGIADQVSDEKLTRLFADGATIVLQGLHRSWEPLLRFGQDLSAELGHPMQINAYVTPPQSRGFDDHYDLHDVFVLQTGGEKQWRIHEPVLQWPLRDQPWTDRRAAVAEAAARPAIIDTVLSPGDCLYLPRGYLHAATALGGVSTHITIGIHAYTRQGVAEELLAEAARLTATDPAFREALPVGTDGDLDDDVETVRAGLVAALGQVDTAALTRGLRAAYRADVRAEPVGPLAQLHAAETLGEDTVVRLRHHLIPALEKSDAGWVLVTRAGRLPLDDAGREGVAILLDGPVPAGRVGVELARRLVRDGLVVVAGPGTRDPSDDS